jgi:hypothetical protein
MSDRVSLGIISLWILLSLIIGICAIIGIAVCFEFMYSHEELWFRPFVATLFFLFCFPVAVTIYFLNRKGDSCVNNRWLLTITHVSVISVMVAADFIWLCSHDTGRYLFIVAAFVFVGICIISGFMGRRV